MLGPPRGALPGTWGPGGGSPQQNLAGRPRPEESAQTEAGSSQHCPPHAESGAGWGRAGEEEAALGLEVTSVWGTERNPHSAEAAHLDRGAPRPPTTPGEAARPPLTDAPDRKCPLGSACHRSW